MRKTKAAFSAKNRRKKIDDAVMGAVKPKKKKPKAKLAIIRVPKGGKANRKAKGPKATPAKTRKEMIADIRSRKKK
jgi:hypothetical protein